MIVSILPFIDFEMLTEFPLSVLSSIHPLPNFKYLLKVILITGFLTIFIAFLEGFIDVTLGKALLNTYSYAPISYPLP